MSKHTAPLASWEDAYGWVASLRGLGYSVGLRLVSGHDRRFGMVVVELEATLAGETRTVVEEREAFPLRGPDKAPGAALRALVRCQLCVEGRDRADLFKLARWNGRPITPKRVAPRE